MILKLIEDVYSSLIFDKGRKTTWVELEFRRYSGLKTYRSGVEYLGHVSIAVCAYEALDTVTVDGSKTYSLYTSLEVLEHRAGYIDISTGFASYATLQTKTIHHKYHRPTKQYEAKQFYEINKMLVFEGHLDSTELTYVLDDFICEKVEDKSIDTLCFDDIQEFIKRHNKPFLRKLKNRKEMDL